MHIDITDIKMYIVSDITMNTQGGTMKITTTLRLSKELHKKLKAEAKDRGFTLNTLINMKLEEATKGKEAEWKD